uniref:FBD domain-containing protein n=1 Tax=Panagrellus redivivus TaxID=6233 RepID=A0A7E4W4A7_PANRE
MKSLQLQKDDAWLKIGMSGKVPFHQFVHTLIYNYGIAHDGDHVYLKAAAKNDQSVFTLNGPKVDCTQMLLNVFSNFVRVVDIYDVWGSGPCTYYATENVTDLKLGGTRTENIRIVELLEFFPRLEALTIFESKKFIKGAKSGSIKLNKLFYLYLHLTPDQLHDLMTMQPPFHLPETVVISLCANKVVPLVSTFITSPRVKKLELVIEATYSITADLLLQLPAILKGFPKTEIPSIKVSWKRDYSFYDCDERERFYHILRNAKFHVSVHMEFEETVFVNGLNTTPICSHLRSIGFTEDQNKNKLTQTLNLSRVHLVHNIKHIDLFQKQKQLSS